MLSVCLPGTGGFMPLGNRWLTCCWMEYQGRALLIDCGEGTQLALRAAGCRLSRLDTLLITHYHADHVAGLPGCCSRRATAARPPRSRSRGRPACGTSCPP